MTIKWSSGMGKRQKILCVCQGGNSRSVHLAYLLKYRYGVDAIACGWEGNEPATVEMLCEWAERIIVVEAFMKPKVNEEFQHKVRIFDVGPDRFFQPNVELLEIFDDMIQNNIRSVEGDQNEKSTV